jgi:hypothetical protein
VKDNAMTPEGHADPCILDFLVFGPMSRSSERIRASSRDALEARIP